eukprot:m.64722 g.64722  ORF g.64722 m.64722 type:complete len:1114 (+) comp11669_c0_seq3:164-3505(+)
MRTILFNCLLFVFIIQKVNAWGAFNCRANLTICQEKSNDLESELKTCKLSSSSCQSELETSENDFKSCNAQFEYCNDEINKLQSDRARSNSKNFYDCKICLGNCFYLQGLLNWMTKTDDFSWDSQENSTVNWENLNRMFTSANFTDSKPCAQLGSQELCIDCIGDTNLPDFNLNGDVYFPGTSPNILLANASSLQTLSISFAKIQSLDLSGSGIQTIGNVGKKDLPTFIAGDLTLDRLNLTSVEIVHPMQINGSLSCVGCIVSDATPRFHLVDVGTLDFENAWFVHGISNGIFNNIGNVRSLVNFKSVKAVLYPFAFTRMSVGDFHMPNHNFINGIPEGLFESIEVSGTLNITQCVVNGNIEQNAFSQMLASSLDLTGCVVNGSISPYAFNGNQVTGSVNMDYLVVTGNISSHAFFRFFSGSYWSMENLRVYGSLNSSCFDTIYVQGDFKMQRSHLPSSGLPSYAFRNVIVTTLDMSDSIINGIEGLAFWRTVVYGNFSFVNCNFEKKGINPYAFMNLNVYGAMNFRYSRFKQNFLKAHTFSGMRSNWLELSECGLNYLSEDENTFHGPFSGLSLVTEAISTSALILSDNNITEIREFAMSGIGSWDVMLDNNNISIMQEGWSRSLSAANFLSMSNNPSQCQLDSKTNTITCKCAKGTSGTGTYCNNLSCNVSTANKEALNGKYVSSSGSATGLVDSGDIIVAKCDPKHVLASGSSEQLQCDGGQFRLKGTLTCTMVPIDWRRIGLIVGSLSVFILIVAFLFLFKTKRDEAKQQRLRAERAEKAMQETQYTQEAKLTGISAAEKEKYELDEKQYSAALQKATRVIAQDELKYRQTWADLLLNKQHAEDLNILDKVEEGLSDRMLRDVVAPRQPQLKGQQGPEYIASLQAMFGECLPTLDRVLKDICMKCNGEIVTCTNKGNDRIFEKAELCYNGDLTRITDIARRSFIFERFSSMANFLRISSQVDIFEIVRIKNRFNYKKFKNVKDTGGYRDLQLIIRMKDTDLLVELQLHIQPIYEIKIGGKVDESGLSGHDRYILFRSQKETAFKLYLYKWYQLSESKRIRQLQESKSSSKVRISNQDPLQMPLLSQSDYEYMNLDGEEEDLYAQMENAL